jgi:hypothetical protein
MKKYILGLFIVLGTCLTSGCHPTTFVVGNGPGQGREVTYRNKYLFLGLKPIGTPADPKVLAKGNPDYSITVKLTFTDLLLNVVTIGIYSPLTVTVKY